MSILAAIRDIFLAHGGLKARGFTDLRTSRAKEGEATTMPYAVMEPQPNVRTTTTSSSIVSQQEIEISLWDNELEKVEDHFQELKKAFPDSIELNIAAGYPAVLSMRLESDHPMQEHQRIWRHRSCWQVQQITPRR